MPFESVLYSSSTDEWYTPKDLYDRLDAEFHFTLDPCASDANHKCVKYYTKEDDGLKQDWGGRAYSAILHMAEKLRSGSKRLTTNRSSQTRS